MLLMINRICNMIVKVKSWPKLILSIILAQSAGLIGSLFTISAISTWYVYLNKPAFSPPNWVFGPVWTFLYTLIGISMYLIWINKKGSLKLFFLHLFLNAIWSPIFFGLKNLGLAFFVIILMDISLIVIIKNFYKLNKIASFILIPYLVWISFASLLNYSVWKLNPQNTVTNIFAQDFSFTKAREDYVFSEDIYRKDLFDFNLKKAAYQKNQTLSLKEELRVYLFKFIESRNNLVRNYLTMLRIKTLESTGIGNVQKETIYTQLDPQVIWFGERKNSYLTNDNLEDIVNKSKEEDSRYRTDTLPIIYYSLANISLGEIKSIKDEHIKLYNSLKKESETLVSLGRADASLFDRWFKDIEKELNDISDIEKKTQAEIDKILNMEDYQRSNAYKKAVEELEPAKNNLLRLNGFVKELEDVISSKR